MWEDCYAFLDAFFGLDEGATDLTFRQMAARATVVFAVAVLLARLGDRRLLGRNAGFDIMILVILGSVLSRGVNGEAAFFPTLGASVLLVLLHQLVAAVAFRSHGFSRLIKGRACVLIRDGAPDERQLARNHITADDLDEGLRLNGSVAHADEVAEARLERNGSISVVKRKPPPA